MGIFTKRKPRNVDRRESLAGLAVVNEGVTITDDGAGTDLSVRVKVPRGPHFLDRFRPPVIEKKYELDELGSFVLRQIDGKKTAKKLIDVFVEHYGLNRRESELCVVSFLKMLMQRGIISLVIADQAKAKPKGKQGRSRKR